MGRIRNANQGNFKQVKKNQGALAVQTPLSSTAVERGSTRWLSGSNVQIEGILDVAGAFNASGVTTISGALTIAGQTGITGPLTIQGVTDIAGQLNVTGPTTLDGDTEIGGLLDITGKTTIRNDLELLAGGLFKAGQTKIEPTGKATFGNVIIDPASIYLIKTPGGWVSGTGADDITLASSASGSVSMNSARTALDYKGAASVLLDDTVSELKFGTRYLRVNANGVAISDALRINTGTTYFEVSQGKLRCTALPTTALAPNVYMDGSGNFFRSTFAVSAA